MKNIKYTLIFALLLSFISVNSQGQSTYDMQFVPTVVGSKLEVQLQLAFDVAADIGSANIVFTFDNAGVSTPVIKNSFPSTSSYSAGSITQPSGVNSVSYNLTLNSTNSGDFNITNIPVTIAIIEFDIIDNTQTTDFTLNTAFSSIFPENESTLLTADMVTNISNFVLPVELTSFTLTPTSSTLDLYWSSASEQNFAGYELQRSTDGKSFAKIVWINGKGSETSSADYRYSDKTITKGQQYYYRLKMVDLDGSFTYSDVVSGILRGKTPENVEIYPNPTKDRLHLNLTDFDNQEEEIRITIFDRTGKVVLTQSETYNTSLSMDISFLLKGLYFLRINERSVNSFIID